MLRSLVATVVLGLVSVGAHAALLGRLALTPGGTDYQAYYDTGLNITWLADANYARTSGYDADGLMTWIVAQGWIASLNTASFLGVNDWRLSAVSDTGAPGCVANAFAGTDCGYNVNLSTGEMAHMFYSTLGNTGYYNTSGIPTGCSDTSPYCLSNDGPFENLQPYVYWSGTEYAPDTSSAWLFGFLSGGQETGNKGNVNLYAWAVTDGDAFAAVSIPSAVTLFGSALALMGVMRRKISS